MKIVRLTENNGQTAFFDNTFNDEIELPPFSEVALSSVSINTNPNFLEINTQSNTIPWGIDDRTKVVREIDLIAATYTEANYERLFFDMYATMNDDINALQTRVGTGIPRISPETGMQWEVSDKPKEVGFGTEGKVSIGYQVANYEGADASSYLATNTAITGTGLSTEVKRSGGTPYTPDASLCGIAPFGWGGARTYMNLKKCAIGGGGSGPQGVIFGLTTTNHASLKTVPTPQTGQIEIYSFGVGSQYTWSVNGTTFTGTDTGAVIAEGDLVGFERVGQGGYIQGVVYNAAGTRRVLVGGNTPTGECEVEWEQFHLDGTTKPLDLFPYIMCLGAGSDVIVDKLQFSPDPYSIIKNKTYSIISKTTGTRGLQNGGLLTPPTTAFIDFTLENSSKVAEYLGFTSDQIIDLKKDQVVTPDKFAWTAKNVFGAGLLTQGFYVELMTGTCEGYDGETGQRKNILAVIPESDSDDKLLFQPATPIFLEMNNNNPLVLRNIRARILQTDGSGLGVTGINSMTLLYKPGKSK